MRVKHILFVDDEQQILDGLRDVLRKERRQWDMVFALGGVAALEELAKRPFDVVVSDMRMPGMDGVAFLQAVKERHPAVARIVLSGHAEQDMVLRALPVAHQYLAKPAQADSLRAVIQNACEYRDVLMDPTIRELVGKLDSFPSLPASYWDLTRAVADPDVALTAVAKIIERDPGLSAKVFQIVNSAFFGLPQKTASIGRAVSYLGLQTIKAVAVSLQVFAAAGQSTAVAGFSIETFQDNALLVAEISKQIVRTEMRSEDAFTAGLLRDTGKLILALASPDKFAQAIAEARASERPLWLVEKEIFGVSHADVGAYLLGTWGLPLPIVTAVAFHHAPEAALSGDGDIIIAVHVADALVESVLSPYHSAATNALDVVTLEQLGVGEELQAWREKATQIIRRRAGNA